MSDDLHDFFNADESWDDGAEPAAMPPAPPHSRREMRRQRAMRKRRNLIICIIVVIALALISVGGVFAYRAARNWRRTNMAH